MKILITGGTGLVGTHLIPLLRGDGHSVRLLSREAKRVEGAESFAWDVENGVVEKKAFEEIDIIIHLAGENISAKRWTEKQKKKIVDSRVQSAELLFKTVSAMKVNLKAFISASAIGYYGAVTADIYFVEDDAPAADFIGTVCKKWEAAADLFTSAGIRTVKIRTSPVLAKDAPLVNKMCRPVKFGLGAPLGSGEQFFPWIHIGDLCEIYRRAVSHENYRGAYNAASPEQPTNKEFMQYISTALKKPLWLPPVPGFLLKLVLGEMAIAVVNGSRVSVRKLLSSGFQFKYGKVKDALADVLISS